MVGVLNGITPEPPAADNELSAADDDDDSDSCSEESDSPEAATPEEIWGYSCQLPRVQAAPDITLKCDVLNIRMSPQNQQVAVASVDGNLSVYGYSRERCTVAAQLARRRASSCRALEYSGDGQLLFSGWSDGCLRIFSLETGALKRRIAGPTVGVNSLLPLTARLMAVGDDDGLVSLWDYRSKESVMSVKQCEDSITDLVADEGQKWLVASSEEGTITSFSLRARKVDTQCDMYDAALTGMALVKDNSRLAVGMASDPGQVNLFKWGSFGQHMSVFKGHPSPVTSIAAITDSLVIMGYDDGQIRLCSLLPHKYVGVVGQHRGRMPVETLSVSADGRLLASCSHDQRVRFWNVEYTQDAEVLAGLAQRRRGEARDRRSRGDSTRPLPSSDIKPSAEFFSDLPKTDQGCFFWD